MQLVIFLKTQDEIKLFRNVKTTKYTQSTAIGGTKMSIINRKKQLTITLTLIPKYCDLLGAGRSIICQSSM